MSASGEEEAEEATRREERGIDDAGAEDDSASPAAATPPSSSSFLSWCRSRGIRIHRSLRCAPVAVGGRGVVSEEAIEAGTALVRVPRRWVFSLGAALAEDGGDDAFRAAVEEKVWEGRGRSSSGTATYSSLLPPEALLACYLLFEAWKVQKQQQRPPSRWEGYISSLPSSYPLLMQTVAVASAPAPASGASPLVERDAVFALFCGIPAALAAAEQAGAEVAGDVAEAAAALVAAAASRSCCKGGGGGDASSASPAAAAASASSFSRERFAWARASVRSRAMFLSDGDDRASSLERSLSSTPLPTPPTPLPLPSSFASAGALLPFGDLFNHAHAPAPEEPDTGGSCGRCKGWHSAPGACSGSEEEEEERREEAGAAAAAATEAAAEEPRPSSSSPPSPPPNSWGDGAFDRATSEFIVRARRSYGEEEEEEEKEGVEKQGGHKGEEEASGDSSKKCERRKRREAFQIFLTYSSGGADADNLATLSNYGFVDASNPHDRCPLSLEAWGMVAEGSSRRLREEARRRRRRDGGKSADPPPLGLRWRSEALEVLLSPSSSQETLSEADSWCHSLSGAPGWNLLAALRSAFLATEVSPSSSFSSYSPSSSSLSVRRAAVASGASPGPAVDAAALSALAEAARAARELARPGDAEQERILERAAAAGEAKAAARAAACDGSCRGDGNGGGSGDGDGSGGCEEEGRASVSEGLLAAACWRKAWVEATERVAEHASRVAEAASAAAAAAAATTGGKKTVK